jgi:hypothetical protein
MSALSPMHSLTTDHNKRSWRVRCIRPGGLTHLSRSPGKAGHGNDRVWKAWKAMKPASHPSHTLWKSLRDSNIPTASMTGDICLLVPPQLERCCRKGLVTDVSGPQRNACPGTLTPSEAWLPYSCAKRTRLSGWALRAGTGSLRRVTEDAERLQSGRRHPPAAEAGTAGIPTTEIT